MLKALWAYGETNNNFAPMAARTSGYSLKGVRGLEFCMILEIIYGLAVSALRFELTSPFHDCRSDDQVISIKVSPSLRNLFAS